MAMPPRYQNDGDPRTPGPGFGLTAHPDTLEAPLRWRAPRRVLVNSMSDLFHREVPMTFIAQVFATMARAEQHVVQVLTKRPQGMARLLGEWGYQFRNQMVHPEIENGPPDASLPLPNVWLGTSIESDRYVFRAPGPDRR